METIEEKSVEREITPEMVEEWKGDLSDMVVSCRRNLKRNSYMLDMLLDHLKRIQAYEKSKEELDARTRRNAPLNDKQMNGENAHLMVSRDE